MIKQRDLYTLLSCMLLYVPTGHEQLKGKLESIRTSVAYSPPENMAMWWAEVSAELSLTLPQKDNLHGDVLILAELFTGARFK